MALFLKTESGDIYQMDATTQVNYQQSGKVTEYAVEAGFNSADHYKHDADRITFNGYVSQAKFLRKGTAGTDLALFEKGMQDLKRSGQFFTCTFSDNLSPMTNCLFDNLTMERDVETSTNSLKVSFVIKQVRVSDQAELSTKPIPAEQYKDMVQEKKAGKGATEEPDEEKGAYLEGVRQDLLS